MPGIDRLAAVRVGHGLGALDLVWFGRVDLEIHLETGAPDAHASRLGVCLAIGRVIRGAIRFILHHKTPVGVNPRRVEAQITPVCRSPRSLQHPLVADAIVDHLVRARFRAGDDRAFAAAHLAGLV